MSGLYDKVKTAYEAVKKEWLDAIEDGKINLPEGASLLTVSISAVWNVYSHVADYETSRKRLIAFLTLPLSF